MPRTHRGKGGPSARLYFFLLLLAMSAVTRAAAEGDPFEDLLGADYGRQLLPGPDAPGPAVGRLPGFPPADSGAAPRLAAGVSLSQRDLIRRDARFAFAHRRTVGAFDAVLGAVPGLEFRFAAERLRRELSMGDTSSSIDLGGEDWGWRLAASFPLTPFFVPSVVVGGRSSAPEADALTALALRGSLPAGFAWSFSLGRRHLDYPVTLKLPDYRPLPLPFLLRQDFQEAGWEYRTGPWQAAWAGRWTQAAPPAVRPTGYSLDDSASLWRQEARMAYDRLRPRAGFRAALDFDLGLGDHVFQGLTRKGQNLYPFSWQKGRQRDYALRADAAMGSRSGTYGAWLAAGESEYDALRPEVAFDHHLWDRNGVIDSYEGSLLGVFSDETWLLNGAAYAAQAGLGIWREAYLWGWRHRVALGYQYLLLQGNSHLTRRQSSFLLAYTESTQDRTYPTVEADLIPIAFDLERAWGPLRFLAGAQAEIPARIRIERGGGGTGSASGGNADYGGGTTARVRLEYRLP